LDRLRLGSHDRPGTGRENDDGDISAGQVLLKRKALIAGDERFEPGFFGFVEQLAVGVTGPAHFGCGAYVVAGKYAGQTARGIFVEQNPNPFEGKVILAKYSMRWMTSRGMLGKISGPAISSAVHPALAFSTMASAWMRVPLMTQAPETRPGTLSTSAHFDQSISFAAMMCLFFAANKRSAA
jgi:hypothetical protein